MKKIIALAAIVIIAGCSNKDAEKHENATPEMVQAVQDAQQTSPPEAQEQPSIPDHYFSMEEDGEYGYEQGISVDDKNSGTATKALIMVRYLGDKNGVYTIQMMGVQGKQLASCSAPCEFVKGKTYFNGELLKTETMKAAHNSIIWVIMQDAQNGKLARYVAKRNSTQ